MTENPFFSIVIPVYNTEKYIARCLESCINQTFQEIEIIIVDDCGTDNAIQIAQNYAKKDTRIKIIHNPHNLGLFHTRFNGIKVASGIYTLFVDSDDFIDIKTCENLYQILQKHLQIDLLHFTSHNLLNNLKSKFNFCKSLKILTTPFFQEKLILGNSFESIWGKAIRTNIIKNAYSKLDFVPSPLNTLEDGLILLALSFEIQAYCKIEKQFYFYCDNPLSITRTITSEAFYKRQKDFLTLFKSIEKLKVLYPNQQNLISRYKNKAISASILNARHHSLHELQEVLFMLQSIKADSKPPHYPIASIYLTSTLLSLRYFFRWQTIARIALYLATFGKIRL